MDILAFKKELVKKYGQKIETRDIDGVKFVDSVFMNWLIEGMLEVKLRVDKLNDELSRIIEHANSLPPDQPDGPAFDEGEAVQQFLDKPKAAVAAGDKTDDLWGGKA